VEKKAKSEYPKLARNYHHSDERWRKGGRGEEELGYREAVELLGERGGFPELLLERLKRLLAVLDLIPSERPGGRVRAGVERVEPPAAAAPAGGGSAREVGDGGRRGPEPPPPRSGEFPVAAAPRRRRLEARIVGGEGELAGGAAGGVVGVAVAKRRRV